VLTVAGRVKSMRVTLDDLARTTWTDIADGRRFGIPMGEVGITDRNMLALRREHPAIIVHKHTSYEEVRTGADWEWWIETSAGWMCLVFQAKILNIDGRYSGVTKGLTEGKPQVDILVRSCLLRSERLEGTVWPFYCFYNSWPEGWPKHVETFDGAHPRNMSAEELQRYGCAAASAWGVREIIIDRGYSKRRTTRNRYLPISRPWSMIFPDGPDFARDRPEETIAALSSWIMGDRKVLPPSPSHDQDAKVPGRTRRRDRLAVYRDPSFVNQLPEYVLDLLEGKVHSRRLKPLARRVVILPGLS
jgi:hypothetical protein